VTPADETTGGGRENGGAGPRSGNGVVGFLRQRPRTARALAAVAVVIVLGAIVAWRYFAVRESTDDAQIDGHIAPIAARVGGTVVAVNVDDNQEVKAGAVLVRLDDTDYKVALQRAEADLAEAQAALQAAREGVPITTTTTASGVSSAAAGVTRGAAGVAASQARLDAAGARLREATANDTRAQRDLERMRQLIEKDEVSRQQYDAAVAAAASARAAVDAARATVNEAEHALAQAEDALLQAQAELRTARTAPNQVAIMRARQASAEAKVKQAQAAAEQARLALGYTTVTAPTDGVISRKTVEVGETVQAGQPLLALVPLDDIWVTANFKETQLRHMHPGQRAVVEVDTYGRSYRGRVESIAAATGARFSLLPPENATGNYVKVVQRVPVKIVLDRGQDPNHLLRPGMSVVPTVFTR
jgi:membrane fusion protein (multidrug efflux system)